MNNEKLELLKKYVEFGEYPLLIQNTYINLFNNEVTISANIDRSELNGHYENSIFYSPKWYNELLDKSKDKQVVLVIDNIDKIKVEDQTKFIDILKYRKIGTFELPTNCLIVVTYSDLSINKINEQIYSLLAHII